MLRLGRAAVALLALSVNLTAAQSCNCDCPVDDCFLALRGTDAFPAQITADDCRAFLTTTVTPATSTFTSTVTTTTRSTSERTEVVTNTRRVSVTEDVVTTETLTTITETTTLPSAVPLESIGVKNLRKRQVTDIRTIPDYAAAACTNSEAYVRACGCIGFKITPTIIELPTPTTTVTITQTRTNIVTSRAFTNTQVTVTGTQTRTVTDTATRTLTDTRAESTQLRLQVTDDDANGVFKGQFFNREADPSSTNQLFVLLNTGGTSWIWYANSAGGISSDDGRVFATLAGGNGAHLFSVETVPASMEQATCRLTGDTGDAERLLDCGSGANNLMAADPGNGRIFLFQSEAQIAANSYVGPLAIKAVNAFGAL
ncbi:hypothetical protein TWF281_009026 [Arthrobotrys megalospora]